MMNLYLGRFIESLHRAESWWSFMGQYAKGASGYETLKFIGCSVDKGLEYLGALFKTEVLNITSFRTNVLRVLCLFPIVPDKKIEGEPALVALHRFLMTLYWRQTAWVLFNVNDQQAYELFLRRLLSDKVGGQMSKRAGVGSQAISFFDSKSSFCGGC